MPIYTYQCTGCGRTEDKLKSMDKRDESIVCSECGGTELRVTSVPAPPKFNGTGWTDKFYNRETVRD